MLLKIKLYVSNSDSDDPQKNVNTLVSGFAY
jgi:hypothetical protein